MSSPTCVRGWGNEKSASPARRPDRRRGLPTESPGTAGLGQGLAILDDSVARRFSSNCVIRSKLSG